VLAAGQKLSQGNRQEHRAICVTSFAPSSAYLLSKSVNKSSPLYISTAKLTTTVCQQMLTTISRYNIINNVCQQELTTECFNSIITTNSSTNITTVSFYTIITANVCQLNITTACSYCVITANVNPSLQQYISTSQTQV
jgi:hypothetical protein